MFGDGKDANIHGITTCIIRIMNVSWICHASICLWIKPESGIWMKKPPFKRNWFVIKFYCLWSTCCCCFRRTKVAFFCFITATSHNTCARHASYFSTCNSVRLFLALKISAFSVLQSATVVAESRENDTIISLINDTVLEMCRNLIFMMCP